jgi:hypothetical protein
MRALILPSLGLLAGCAFILGEETKTIRLVSDPPGAEVAMDGLLDRVKTVLAIGGVTIGLTIPVMIFALTR